MSRGKLIENAACAAVIGLMLIASPSSSENAQQPPRNCRAVPKIEYDSAKRENLLRNRNGAYIRTGGIWRRYYWYCHN